MDVALTLGMPRERLSIPLVRHVVRAAMVEAGVARRCSDDIQVALSEACTNAVDHSGGAEEFRVRFEMRDRLATIEVEDGGGGYDPGAVGPPDPMRERGRGLALMRQMVDMLVIGSGPGCGTVVVMRKRLEFGEDGTRPPASRRNGTGALGAAASRPGRRVGPHPPESRRSIGSTHERSSGGSDVEARQRGGGYASAATSRPARAWS
jgi:serine/threonine-protein kinase RsbW